MNVAGALFVIAIPVALGCIVLAFAFVGDDLNRRRWLREYDREIEARRYDEPPGWEL